MSIVSLLEFDWYPSKYLSIDCFDSPLLYVQVGPLTALALTTRPLPITRPSSPTLLSSLSLERKEGPVVSVPFPKTTMEARVVMRLPMTFSRTN